MSNYKLTFAALLFFMVGNSWGQTYCLPGNELDLVGAAAGDESAFFNFHVPDDFVVEDLNVRIKAHVIQDDPSDEVRMDFETYISIDDPELPSVYMYDHNCAEMNFSELDMTFNDEAGEHINLACSSLGEFKSTTKDRLEADIDYTPWFSGEHLSGFEGQNANQVWRLAISFKPFFTDDDYWPEHNVKIDTVFLIFNNSSEKGELISTVGIDEKSKDQNFTVYPNPVNSGDLFTLNHPSASYDIELYSVSGKQLLVQKNNVGKTELNTENLPAGLYLVQLISDGNRETKKLIIR